jgi:pimeloyl-ACP methyl ester carboxylesterase
MPTAHINGIDIWYEFEGEGPPLVLTHGFAGPNGGWPPVVYELRSRFRLLLYDVRAHGKTTVPDDASTVTMPQFAADLCGLLDHLGLERPHVAGVSMGGMISAQFACDFPDRLQSLWLCDTTAGNQGDPATAHIERQMIEVFERTERIVAKHGFAELMQRENRYRREGDPYAAKNKQFTLDEQDQRNLDRIGRMTDAGFIATNIAVRERPDLTTRTPKIAVPTLISCGEWDMFYPLAQRDHHLIAGSRFATVRGAAHDSAFYTPHLFKRVYLDFIDDLEAGRAIAGEREYS